MITIDMNKAKVIAHDVRRIVRNAAFAPLDIKQQYHTKQKQQKQAVLQSAVPMQTYKYQWILQLPLMN